MTAATPTSTSTPMTSSPPRTFATTAGVAYAALGIVGFAMTGTSGFASRNGVLLLGVLEVNPLHNLVHLLLGLALVAGASRSDEAARHVTVVVGVATGVVGLLGPLITRAGELALNHGDTVLHLGTALLALGAILADRKGAPAR
jgi:hypothetical protein